MPQFYFHLKNDTGEQRDHVGEEHGTRESAVRRAGQSVGDILGDDLSAGRSDVSIELTVERDGGVALAKVMVSARVERLD